LVRGKDTSGSSKRAEVQGLKSGNGTLSAPIARNELCQKFNQISHWYKKKKGIKSMRLNTIHL